jgi:hypothetical protein
MAQTDAEMFGIPWAAQKCRSLVNPHDHILTCIESSIQSAPAYVGGATSGYSILK